MGGETAKKQANRRHKKTPPKRGLCSEGERLALQQRQNLLWNLVSFCQH